MRSTDTPCHAWPSFVRVAIVVASLAALGAPSSAGARSGDLVKVLTPKKRALATSPAVEVRVRVSERARHFEVFDGLDDVTDRFSADRRMRSATLSLDRGLNPLYVRARTAAGSVDFEAIEVIVAHRDRGLLRMRHDRDHSRGGQVAISARAAAGVDEVRARINGKPARRAFEDEQGGVLKLSELDADHGIRHGINRIVLTAYTENGRFDREVERIRVPRNRPLAGAGPGRVTEVGDAVRLEPGRAVATRAGAKLQHRWKIVDAPQGSTATLETPSSRRPRLRPDVHGTYELRLTVAETRPGPASGAAGRGLVEPMAVGSDVAIVDVTPAAALTPLGLPIKTLPAPGRGITVGSQEFAVAQDWLQIVVLDGKTLATDQAGTISTAESPAAIAGYLQAAEPSDLVIMTGGGREVNLSSAQVDAVLDAFKRLGGTQQTLPTNRSDRGLGTGHWSLIGRTGAAAEGTAWQAYGPPAAVGVESGGALDGLLQLGLRTPRQFAFISPDYVSFDTSAPGAPEGANRVVIGSSTYDSPRISQTAGSDDAGFHLLIVDQNTLSPLVNEVYATNSTQLEPLPEQIAALANRIESFLASQKPVLVILQSIGQPRALEPTWPQVLMPKVARVGAHSVSIGGTPDVFLNLGAANPAEGSDGAEGYAIVGGSKLPGFTPAETTGLSAGQTGAGPFEARLVGVLERNRQSQFVANHWSPLERTLGPGLYELAYQPRTPWSAADPEKESVQGDAERAAAAYFAEELSDCPGGASCPQLGNSAEGIREEYIDKPDTQSKWTELSGRLTNQGSAYVPCPADPQGFTDADCGAVRSALIEEFAAVGETVTMISQLQDKFVSTESGSLVNVASIATDVNAAVNPPPSSTAGVSPFSIASLTTSILAQVSGFIPVAGQYASAGLGLTATGLGMAAAVSGVEPGGGTSLTGEIEVEASHIAATMAASFAELETGLNGVRDLIVSDFGKLQATATRINATPAESSWDLTSSTQYTAITETMEIATRQEINGSLLAIPYKAYYLSNHDQPGGNTGGARANDLFCPLHLFGNPPFAPTSFGSTTGAQYGSTTGFQHVQGSMQPIRKLRVLNVKSIEIDGGTPPAKIVNPLFLSPQAAQAGPNPNLGLDQERFFTQFAYQELQCLPG